MVLKIKRVNIIVLLSILSGFLMCTSIVNIGKVGIPVFYVILPLLSVYLLVYIQKPSTASLNPIISLALFVGFPILLLLLLPTFGHVILSQGDGLNDLKQIIARMGLVLLFILVSFALIVNKADHLSLAYSKVILKICILYGLYQLYADVFNLMRPLDFLRNSVSFSIVPNLSGTRPGATGWLKMYRIYSIWSEPSYSALPVGLMFYILIFHVTSLKEKVMWYFLTMTYGILTFSRLVWIVLFYLILYIALSTMIKNGYIHRLFEKFKYLGVVLLAAVSTSWVYYAPDYMSDISSLGRSGSTIIGMRAFLDNILFGTGMNTYEDIQHYYGSDLINYHEETVVHNLFVGYAQQLGIFGLIYSFLPIFFILSLRSLGLNKRIYFAGLFSVIGSFGGDIFYMSLSWLTLALLCAENYLADDKRHLHLPCKCASLKI